jgi:5-methylcytosine-specific restriction endonuclease McrA
MGGQHHAPAALLPEKTRYPLGGPQGRSGRVRKISTSTGIRSPDRPARSQSLYRLSYLAYILFASNLPIMTCTHPDFFQNWRRYQCQHTFSKGTVVPVLVMKAYRWRGDIAPLILNLGTRWSWSASSRSRLHSGHEPLATHRTVGRVGPITGLDVSENRIPLFSCQFSSPLPRKCSGCTILTPGCFRKWHLLRRVVASVWTGAWTLYYLNTQKDRYQNTRLHQFRYTKIWPLHIFFFVYDAVWWYCKIVCEVHKQILILKKNASFPCKINSLERGLRMQLQAREFKWGLSVNMWSDVEYSDMEWTAT